MKFSLPASAKDEGPKKGKTVMPPASAGKHVASQGPKGSPSGHGPNGKTGGPAGKSMVGFHGAPKTHVPKSLAKPPYEHPKKR